MSARKIPEAIQWHDGMLLNPEHFQQMTQRLEMLSEFAMKCLPFRWGLITDASDPRRLAYDPNLLVSGLLVVSDLEAVMPDGTFVHTDASAPLKLELKPFVEQLKQAPAPIYLLLPARKAAEVKGDLPRYESVPALAEGARSNGADSDIPRLLPRLSLMAGPEPIPPKYTGFPLVHVRHENGSFLASPDFHPPVLSVPRSSPLGVLCLEIAQHIREKATYLAELVRSSPPETSPRRLLQIQSLVAGLPAFEALLYTDRAHPYSLYLALCSIAGNVAGVGNELLPPPFPAYDHDANRAAFERVRRYVYHVLEEGISEKWISFRFHREDKKFALSASLRWADTIPPETVRGRVNVVLGVRAPVGASENRIGEWGRNCLIGARSVIPSLIAKRILGVAREPLEWLEDPVPAQGMTLFALTPDPEWIRPDEDLLAFDPRTDSVLPTEVFFYVRRIN